MGAGGCRFGGGRPDDTSPVGNRRGPVSAGVRQCYRPGTGAAVSAGIWEIAGGRLTSNNQSVVHLGVGVPVEAFTEHEALAYLAERTGRKDDNGALFIAQELGWLPLALAQAAAVIADQHLDYRTYLDRLRGLPVSKLLVRVQAGQYPHGLAEAVLLSLEGVRDQGDTGKMCTAVIEMVSVLALDGVPRVLLYTAVSCDALAWIRPSVPMSDAAVDEALGRLAGLLAVTFSLDGGHVRAHRLVMRVVREKMTQERLGIVCQAVSSVLISHARSVREDWKRFSARELVEQISAVYEHMESLSGEMDEPGSVNAPATAGESPVSGRSRRQPCPGCSGRR